MSSVEKLKRSFEGLVNALSDLLEQPRGISSSGQPGEESKLVKHSTELFLACDQISCALQSAIEVLTAREDAQLLNSFKPLKSGRRSRGPDDRGRSVTPGPGEQAGVAEPEAPSQEGSQGSRSPRSLMRAIQEQKSQFWQQLCRANPKGPATTADVMEGDEDIEDDLLVFPPYHGNVDASGSHALPPLLLDSVPSESDVHRHEDGGPAKRPRLSEDPPVVAQTLTSYPLDAGGAIVIDDLSGPPSHLVAGTPDNGALDLMIVASPGLAEGLSVDLMQSGAQAGGIQQGGRPPQGPPHVATDTHRLVTDIIDLNNTSEEDEGPTGSAANQAVQLTTTSTDFDRQLVSTALDLARPNRSEAPPASEPAGGPIPTPSADQPLKAPSSQASTSQAPDGAPFYKPIQQQAVLPISLPPAASEPHGPSMTHPLQQQGDTPSLPSVLATSQPPPGIGLVLAATQGPTSTRRADQQQEVASPPAHSASPEMQAVKKSDTGQQSVQHFFGRDTSASARVPSAQAPALMDHHPGCTEASGEVASAFIKGNSTGGQGTTSTSQPTAATSLPPLETSNSPNLAQGADRAPTSLVSLPLVTQIAAPSPQSQAVLLPSQAGAQRSTPGQQQVVVKAGALESNSTAVEGGVQPAQTHIVSMDASLLALLAQRHNIPAALLREQQQARRQQQGTNKNQQEQGAHGVQPAVQPTPGTQATMGQPPPVALQLPLPQHPSTGPMVMMPVGTYPLEASSQQQLRQLQQLLALHGSASGGQQGLVRTQGGQSKE